MQFEGMRHHRLIDLMVALMVALLAMTLMGLILMVALVVLIMMGLLRWLEGIGGDFRFS